MILYKFFSFLQKMDNSLENLTPSELEKLQSYLDSLRSSDEKKDKKTKVKEPKNKVKEPKVKEPKQDVKRWLTEEEYDEKKSEYKCCGKKCSKGPNKDLFCGSKVVDDEYCSKCVPKKNTTKAKNESVVEDFNKPTLKTSINKVLTKLTNDSSENIEHFISKINTNLKCFVNKNVGGGYLFCRNDGFKGLVMEGELDSDDYKCIGKLNKNVSENTSLSDNWKNELIELDENEIEFISKYNIIYDFNN